MSICTTPKSIIVSLVISDPGGGRRADLPVGVHDLVAALPGEVGRTRVNDSVIGQFLDGVLGVLKVAADEVRHCPGLRYGYGCGVRRARRRRDRWHRSGGSGPLGSDCYRLGWRCSTRTPHQYEYDAEHRSPPPCCHSRMVAGLPTRPHAVGGSSPLPDLPNTPPRRITADVQDFQTDHMALPPIHRGTGVYTEFPAEAVTHLSADATRGSTTWVNTAAMDVHCPGPGDYHQPSSTMVGA
jgi:hypothetical protein